MALIHTTHGKTPHIPNTCFVASNATLCGDVNLGENVSIWFQAVVRGDVMPISIGNETNIQDGAIIHGTYKKAAASLGHRVSVGHGAILHGCSIGDETLIGMGAIVMDHAKVGKRCIIGAKSLVTENTEIPDGHLALGSPAKVIRPLKEKELEFVSQSADNYLKYKTWYPMTPNPSEPEQ